MAVEFQFPIDKLPERPFSYVLRTMGLVDRVAYTFISPETKQQICSIPQYQDASMTVVLTDFIRIEINLDKKFRDKINFYFYEYEVLYPEFTLLPDLPTPQLMKIERKDESIVLPNTKEFSFKQYIDHLSEIFHCKECTLNLEIPEDLYPSEPMKKAFIRFPQITRVNVTQKCSEQIAFNFVSKAEQCNITETHPFGPKTLQKIYIQKIPVLRMPRLPITLNDLLMINGTDVHVTLNVTYKELNLFVKSWQAGTHPQLEKLSIYSRKRDKRPNAADLFNGIGDKEASEENKMKFIEYQDPDEHYGSKDEVFKVRDIWTKDGSRKATILLKRNIPGMKMIVHG